MLSARLITLRGWAKGPALVHVPSARRLFQLAADEAREKTVEDKIENRLANDRLLENSYDSLLKRY
ncbi:MAG: hypothetical protein QF412_04395 [Planctomycetota bacterium]|nr:hypothetical protein [Planctomycetota bacterium]